MFLATDKITGPGVALRSRPFAVVAALARVPQASMNIYEQQSQMGRFLREYYPGASVALNDIGAPSYFGNVKVLDLIGRASIEVARQIRAGRHSGSDIAELASKHEVRVAIVYDHWFQELPPEWVRAGTWTVRENRVLGATWSRSTRRMATSSRRCSSTFARSRPHCPPGSDFDFRIPDPGL